MSLGHVNSRVVLGSLHGEETPANAHLSNSAKQVYKLQIVDIDSAGAKIRFQAPRGRRAPIDPLDDWTLLLRNNQGAYLATVLKLVPGDEDLTCVLSDRMQFLARRKSIRLAAGPRGPITVSFQADGKHYRGRLVDFSLDGLGIQVDGEYEWAVGDHLQNGHFELRGYQVQFQDARIAHCHPADGGLRLGLAFAALSDEQARIIRRTFDAWYLSQRSSFSDSSALDG